MPDNSQNCKFKYDYHAKKDQNLLFRHWQDRATVQVRSRARSSRATLLTHR